MKINLLIEKQAHFSTIKIENPHLDPEKEEFISDLNKRALTQNKFQSELVERYGEEFYSNLVDFDMLSNLIYVNIYDLLVKKGYKYIGFQYYKHFEKTAINSCISLIIVSDLESELIISYEELPEDIIGPFFALKDKITNDALSHGFPCFLEEYISKSEKLKKAYLEYLHFPLGDRFAEAKIGAGLNGQIDRGIIGALTLLNDLEIESWSSCFGHYRFDEAGLEGAVVPSIDFKIDSEGYKDLIDFKLSNQDYSLIAIYPFTQSESSGELGYKITAGNNFLLEVSDGPERSVILSYLQSTLNKFILDYYKSKSSTINY